jgi:molybdopterin-binding protein
MNRVSGIIKEVKKSGEIERLIIEAQNELFSVLILSSSESYEVSQRVDLLFKENEVMVATVESKVSARNSFVSKIIEIEEGEILANVTFDFYGLRISSIITKEALKDLACCVGDESRWFVKSNEISILKVN